MVTPVPAPPSVIAGGEADVVIVAVTYNSAEIVEPFLRALPAAFEGINSVRVVIIDNASADTTVSRVRALAPWATLVENDSNQGFAAGINAGLRTAAPREALVVLNPDAVPHPRSVRLLLDALESDRSTGIAVPRMQDSFGRLSLSLRREPTILRALGEALIGGRRAGAISMLGETISVADAYVDGASADWATGAALAIRRDVMDVVGPWSEEYFLYSEETDYALRVRDAGYCLRYVAAAHVTHRGGELQNSPFLWSLQAVNRVRLYRSRNGPVLSAIYWSAVMLNELIRVGSGRSTHRAAVSALRKHALGRRLL